MRRVFLLIGLVTLGLFLVIKPPLLWNAARDTGPANLSAPAGERPTHIDPSGETVLPNGRLITPEGVQVTVEPHPYGMALSPDGNMLVTANTGTWPFSISIISTLASHAPEVRQIPPSYPAKHSEVEPSSVYMGLAIDGDNRTAYISEGDTGKIDVYDLQIGQKSQVITLDRDFNGRNYRHSFSGALALSPDSKLLYALDLAHFELVGIETRGGGILWRVGVGRLPFAVAVSPNGDRVYVSNVGTFQYSVVPEFDLKRAGETGLDFPPFATGTPEAEKGTVVAGKRIPGLGDPNVPESNSVFVLDAMGSAPRVVARIRTGLAIGNKSVGGSSPGAVVAGHHRFYVSNSAQDSISILDAQKNRLVTTTRLEPAPGVGGLRGVLPFGLALSPDESRLYIACAGINAVAVFDTKSNSVLGYIPTGWFPARVAVSKDGRTLYVANAKGYGAGPNAGANFQRGPEGDYIGDITKGTISIIPVPSGAELAQLSNKVIRNNGFAPATAQEPRSQDFPIPSAGGPSSRLQHVVFIVKENRTYDEVLGDIRTIGGAEVNGDPTLARWGLDAEVNDEGQPTLQHVRVTPNHHALAQRFGLSDNYYVDSDVSFDGHHWLVDSYPNEWVETTWPPGYGGHSHLYYDDDAPGRLSLGGSSSLRPEDYLEAGSLWEHLARHHISFRNYGEGLSGEGDEGFEPTGLRLGINLPISGPLFENTSRIYPTFNTSIPDQYRFEQFKKEFEERYERGPQPFPQFTYIWLPNDHTAKPRPEDGYAYHASYVADNDLALGKIIELLSHSKFWPEMAVFITEDDAQNGHDHVDAHRSVLLVVSPFSRRGVSHAHTSMLSILKTLEHILGLPPLNQYDAAATDLSDCFTDIPDISPYVALPSDPSIFDPAKARDPLYSLRKGKPLPPSEPLDDPARIRREMNGGR
ncbi:MAG: bifunctional YncE family protein/alkaline phosphatase family protein [Terriglobia bacterium]